MQQQQESLECLLAQQFDGSRMPVQTVCMPVYMLSSCLLLAGQECQLSRTAGV
jgi:hypothetical protein